MDFRITVIDSQGAVIGESEKDPSFMGDHSGRLEVVKAVEQGFGQSTRFSNTLGYNMKYVAVRLDDKDRTLGVVRLALPLSEVQLEMQVVYRVILVGAIVSIAVALTVAYFISKSITSPIRQMQAAAHIESPRVTSAEKSMCTAKTSWASWLNL